MKTLFACAAALLASALYAAPKATVGSVTISDSGCVQVDYTLNEEAIVTAAFEYDGEPVPANKATFLAGEVNKLVAKTEEGKSARMVWNAARDGAFASACAASKLKVKLTAWPKTNPPDYMVVNLSCKNSRMFYVSADAIPYGGVTNRIYKSEYFVMRRIPAAGVVWRMGVNGNSGNAIPHYVKLTEDYYIGIYKLTRAQYRMVMKGWVGLFDDKYGEWAPYGPATNLSFIYFRGNALWPVGGHTVTDENCPIYKFREQTGLQLDLPTDAQWEFAARAGQSGDYANATRYDPDYKTGSGRGGDVYGWYNHYGDGEYAHTVEVGLYPANPYGLYDLHGNAIEKCLDYYATGNDYAAHFGTHGNTVEDPVEDPEGPESGAFKHSTGKYVRVGRAGAWSDGETKVHGKTAGTNVDEETSGQYVAYRLVCPLPW